MTHLFCFACTKFRSETEQKKYRFTYANSQSAVKARDLRSNDKRVLAIKKAYELKYPSGYFITKRGEQAPADRNKDHVVELSALAKNLIAWHSQRPNLSYGETKILISTLRRFSKTRTIRQRGAFALNQWMVQIYKTWVSDNPLNFSKPC